MDDNAKLDLMLSIGKAARSGRDVGALIFVDMVENDEDKFDSTIISEHVDLFEYWEYPIAYSAGQIRIYDGILYRCLQAHTSQVDWTPAATASLWTKIADPAEEWPEWSQPIGAHDAYDADAKTSHKGKRWINTHGDGNVWEPGVYGWTEVNE